MKRLMILGGGPNQIPLIEAAKKNGYYVVLCDYSETAPGVVLADELCLVSIMDKEGVLNPEAKVPVTVSVEGPGMILGFGSADPESEENFYDLTAVPFEGRLRAAVRGTGEKGTIIVSLCAEGAGPVKVEIPAE